MMKTRTTLLPQLSSLLLLLSLAAPALAESPPAKILYVGAISINPSQEAKVLADWYARLGIETKEIQGMYFAKIETGAGPLAFAIHRKKPNASAKSSGSVSFVLRVDNFEASVAAAKDKGLVPASTEKDPFGQYAHFQDPDGNEVTLWGK